MRGESLALACNCCCHLNSCANLERWQQRIRCSRRRRRLQGQYRYEPRTLHIPPPFHSHHTQVFHRLSRIRGENVTSSRVRKIATSPLGFCRRMSCRLFWIAAIVSSSTMSKSASSPHTFSFQNEFSSSHSRASDRHRLRGSYEKYEVQH